MKGEIRVENLIKIYKTFNFKKRGFLGIFKREEEHIIALNNINFDISPGEIVGYIGPNGAGKTTTVKILSGILYPTSGSVFVNGISPFDKKKRKVHRKNIGVMLGHHSRLIRDLPVIESFLLLGKIYGLSQKEIYKRIKELAEVLQIEQILNQQVRTLSLGQRTRCELLATFLHSPPVLFLDEPTIGVDLFTRHRVYDFLKKINKEEKITIIITSHNIYDIEILADRIILIDKGKILFNGKKDKFIDEFGSKKKRIFIKTENVVKKEEIDKFLKETPFEIKHFNGYEIVLETDLYTNIFNALKNLGKYLSVKDMYIERESLEEVIKNIYEANK